MAAKKTSKKAEKQEKEVTLADKLNTNSPTKEEADKGVTIEDKVKNDGSRGQLDVPNGQKHRDLSLG